MKDTECVGFPDMIDAGTYQTTLEEEGIPGGALPILLTLWDVVYWLWSDRCPTTRPCS